MRRFFEGIARHMLRPSGLVTCQVYGLIVIGSAMNLNNPLLYIAGWALMVMGLFFRE